MFDYAIIGLGAAGLQLALQMAEDAYFNDKNVLLLDKVLESEEEKTWCYWEKGVGKWDHLVYKEWEETEFIGPKEHLKIRLKPYTYKMLKSADFRRYALQQLTLKKNFKISVDTVTSVKDTVPNESGVDIVTELNNFKALHVFDSRIPLPFFKDTKAIHLKQHFKGWTIKTKEAVFNDNAFTMMDFSVAYDLTTSFMYVLPTSPTTALLEYTFFTSEVCDDALYDELIESYIEEQLPALTEYRITNTEQGVIPMTTYKFQQHHTKNVTKIGTAGGWVRPSTGYSFKNCERNVTTLLANLKSGKALTNSIYKTQHHIYDTLLLDILKRDNHKGPELFETMFKKNDIDTVFQFLNGTSSFWDDLEVMFSYRPKPFIDAILRRYLS